jgi:hypothetical protein
MKSCTCVLCALNILLRKLVFLALIVAAQRALNSLKAQLRFALLVFKVCFAFAARHFSS